MLGIDGWSVGIDGQVVCRIKKLNGDGKSSAYPTGRARAISANHMDLLDGLPPEATIVDIGPVLNDLSTGFNDVQAIRVVDTRFIIDFPESKATVMPTPLPLIDTTAPRFTIVHPSKEDVSGEPK